MRVCIVVCAIPGLVPRARTCLAVCGRTMIDSLFLHPSLIVLIASYTPTRDSFQPSKAIGTVLNREAFAWNHLKRHTRTRRRLFAHSSKGRVMSLPPLIQYEAPCEYDRRTATQRASQTPCWPLPPCHHVAYPRSPAVRSRLLKLAAAQPPRSSHVDYNRT